MSIKTLEKYFDHRGFFTVENRLWEHVKERQEECFKKATKVRESIKTKEEHTAYVEKMRKDFIDAMGGLPYDPSLPLNARITGVIEEEGFKIEKVIFQSRPNVYVTANMYIPEKRKDPCGTVLFQLGHAAEGKAYPVYQRVARSLVSAGLIVFAMDPIGQGERLDYYEPEINGTMIGPCVPSHQYAGEQCVLAGDNIARYFIADGMRAVDYLLTRPEVDKDKIGATGNSGGGLATCCSMVCDPRIAAAAPGTFVTSRREYYSAGRGPDSEQIWLGATKRGFDHHETLICFAPKPAMILAVDSDILPIEGTHESYQAAKPFWEMYGKGEQFHLVVDKALHAYTIELAAQASEFFAEVLNGEKRKAATTDIKILSEKELWCTKQGQVKLEFEDAKFIFDENRERLLNSEKPEMSAKEFLRQKIDGERVRNEVRIRNFDKIVENGLVISPMLWFTHGQIPNFAFLFSHYKNRTDDEIVICLWDKGTDNIEEHINKIRKICFGGKRALVLDITGIGKMAPRTLTVNREDKERNGVLDCISKNLFFLDDSLCAIRMFDLEFAIDVVCEKLGGKASLYAEGVCAHFAELLRIVKPEVKVETSNEAPSYLEIVNTKYYEDYNISGSLLPGIARYLDGE